MKIDNNIYNKFLDWNMFFYKFLKKVDLSSFIIFFISDLEQNNFKLNLYLHVPFCKSSCIYCPYYKLIWKLDKKLVENWYQDTIKRIENWISYLKKYINTKQIEIETISIGGGTPSYIPSYYLKNILEILIKNFNFNLREFTIEINPTIEDFNNILTLKSYGLNRLSLWIQTFDKEITKITGRQLKNKDVFKVIELTEKEFDNYNIDMIYGLPNQNLNILNKDIKILNRFNIKHISYYPLYLFKNTYLYNNINKYNLPFLKNWKYDYKEIIKWFRIIKEKLKIKPYTMDYFALNKKYYHKYQLNYLYQKPLLPLNFWYWWSIKTFVYNWNFYIFDKSTNIWLKQLFLSIRLMSFNYNFKINKNLYKNFKSIIDIIKKKNLEYQYRLWSYFNYLLDKLSNKEEISI